MYHFLLGNLYAVSAPYSSVDSFFSLQNAQLQLSAQSLLLHLTFRLTIFFKFGFLGQSSGQTTMFNFSKKKSKNFCYRRKIKAI